MNSFNSMKSKLDNIGIYKITEESNIATELKIYAKELDKIFEEIRILEQECFIDTAQDYGLLQRENFLGFDRSYMSIEDRRKMLKATNQMTGSCTPEAFNLMLESYGVQSFEIVEQPSEYSLKVYIHDQLDDEEKKLIESRVEGDFPIHLVNSVIFD